MQTSTTGLRIGIHRIAAVALAAVLLAGAITVTAVRQKSSAAADQASGGEIAVGKDLFLREWLPNDSRTHGGDGLGPAFNDSSCVACHNQGGTGGGGPASKNVDVVSAFAMPTPPPNQASELLKMFVAAVVGVPPALVMRPAPPKPDKQVLLDELAKVHPGFRAARSVVLHRSSAVEGYDKWRATIKGEFPVMGSFDFPSQFVAGVPVPSALLPVNVPGNAGVAVEAVESPVVPSRFLFAERIVQAGPPAAAALPPGGPSQPEHSTAPGRFFAAVRQLISLTQLIEQHVQQAAAFGVDSAPLQHAVLPATATEVEETQAADVAFDSSVDIRNFTSQHGRFLLIGSQRNTTSLFGAGQIDSIPPSVLEAAAKQRFAEFPEVTGRVSRLKDGTLGRFGWKSQKATLREFAMTACAVELGLHVPEHEQAGVPNQPEYKAPGLDMNQRECDALVAYLRQLPAPVQHRPGGERNTQYVDSGKAIFTRVGCAACHTPQLGSVDGIYSDLLLHDMGESLADNGSYGVFVPDSPGDSDDEPIVEFTQAFQQPPKKLTPEEQERDEAKAIGAQRLEWRTPPLWGVRDSSPYLHDGRAQTLESAIHLHDGEARASRKRFSELSSAERLQLVSFLKSLTAP